MCLLKSGEKRILADMSANGFYNPQILKSVSDLQIPYRSGSNLYANDLIRKAEWK